MVSISLHSCDVDVADYDCEVRFQIWCNCTGHRYGNAVCLRAKLNKWVAVAHLRQDDGVAGDDTDEEGTAEEERSQSLGSDSDDAGAADDEDGDDDEAAGRRLNIRTSALSRMPPKTPVDRVWC